MQAQGRRCSSRGGAYQQKLPHCTHIRSCCPLRACMPAALPATPLRLQLRSRLRTPAPHVTCLRSTENSSFLRPMVRRSRTSSRSTCRGGDGRVRAVARELRAAAAWRRRLLLAPKVAGAGRASIRALRRVVHPASTPPAGAACLLPHCLLLWCQLRQLRHAAPDVAAVHLCHPCHPYQRTGKRPSLLSNTTSTYADSTACPAPSCVQQRTERACTQ